jgi:thiamine pyrophosphokinase
VEDARVIAADGGLAEAVRLGLHVDVVVGDLDSASPAEVAAAEAGGAEVQRHPEDKDATDLELAMERALGDGADRIVVAGGGGGRLDHLLGNALLLASPRWAAATVDAVLGEALLTVVRHERTLHGAVGSLVSLVALGGHARGVDTDGLRWPLANADLAPGTTWGISNEFVAPTALVRVRDGVVVAIQPGGAS